MTYQLFIDDERFPPEDDKFWVIARTSCEAIEAVKRLGMPEFISFDHDLGGDKTSIKFVNWLTNSVLDAEVDISKEFKFYVHSQNPIGKANIESKMNSLIKHYGI